MSGDKRKEISKGIWLLSVVLSYILGIFFVSTYGGVVASNPRINVQNFLNIMNAPNFQ